MPAFHAHFFMFCFSLLVACFCAALVSGVVLWMTHRRVNALLKHPYLERQAFHQYPFSIQLAILLDYFLRITFPRVKWGLMGNANKLLKQTDPRDVPLMVKWPLVGLWGGCFLGLLAMIGVWSAMLMAR